jgi:hypothetical protein
MVGAFEGTLNFETGPLQNPGARDLFIAKLSQNGTLLWATSVGGLGQQVAEDVVVDVDGNIYVTGWFTEEVDDEGAVITSGGEADGLIVSYAPDGTQRWLVPVSGPEDLRLSAIAVTADEDLVVGGHAQGPLTLGTCQASASSTDDDALLMTLTGSSGFCTNVRVLGSDGAAQRVTALAVDGEGVFVTVTGRGSVDFGSGPIDAGTADRDVWLARLGLGLAPSWTVLVDGPGDETAERLAGDGRGGLWLLGATSATPAPGGSTTELDDGGERDVLLAHYDQDGEELFRASFGGPYDQVGRAVAVDSAGNLAIAGDFELRVDFGDGAIESGGGTDVFVAKLDREGEPIWSRPFGSKMNESTGGLALDDAGAIALGFDFEDRVVLGEVNHRPEGARDVLITRLNP